MAAKSAITRRDPIARSLAHGLFQPKRVPPKKGAGSFKRQPKHRNRELR